MKGKHLLVLRQWDSCSSDDLAFAFHPVHTREVHRTAGRTFAVCRHHRTQLYNVPICPDGSLAPDNCLPPGPRQSLTYFVSMDRPILDISCEWNGMCGVFALWILLLKTMFFEVYPCPSTHWQSIPFSG